MYRPLPHDILIQPRNSVRKSNLVVHILGVMMSITPDHEGIRNGPEKSPRSTVRSFGHPCSYMDDIIPDSRILSDMQFEYSTLENCALRWNINSYLTRESVLCSHKPCAVSLVDQVGHQGD
ncbi:hypothetical protein M8J75_005360 [Diaphorina citri]|nr:hypothetical protein M8J75_005360 [Diaphorina citri]